MIVDSSAIITILRGEPEAESFINALAHDHRPLISAVTYIEAAIIADSNHDPILSGQFNQLLASACIEIEPVTKEQSLIAREAYRNFGKGSGHPASLNFGDCFAYALSIATSQPLLFKGKDFGQTDVKPVIQPRA
jgi:ribonuclease VapC